MSHTALGNLYKGNMKRGPYPSGHRMIAPRQRESPLRNRGPLETLSWR
ncbi:hypothetical protein LY56_03282 [Roseinatronobacter thiooxidans]|uniref:Uncharacterized protein n=1 Tax=Roseinatronobacter thiooxidans TaxID=121821 RepID=A0A2W7PYJ8_9RHOB|nr:hypothetical protein LY56_03282 [Roseinatronobacter thiooxidans]